jgi:transposase
MNAILGIDIAKKKFDIALLIDNKIKHKVYTNNKNGFVMLSKFLASKDINKLHACMEATGTYGEALATYLYNHGYTISVVNPARIKGFAQSNLCRNKTDKLDAKTIANFCAAIKPESLQPTPEHIKSLQVLVKRYEQLIDMKQQEANRLSSLSDNEAVLAPMIKETISYLETQITIITAKIEDFIDNNPTLKNKKTLLESIPGIGKITIPRILASIGQPALFSNVKKLVAFLGLNPKHCQSGSSINRKTRISKTGNADLRKAFYFPAIVAMRHNPVIKTFCTRLANNGKAKMIIVGAAMRKLIHIIYGVLKSNKPFNPAFTF